MTGTERQMTKDKPPKARMSPAGWFGWGLGAMFAVAILLRLFGVEPARPPPAPTTQEQQGLQRWAKSLVQLHGWRCDEIDSMRPFWASRGYHLRCNGRYSYTITDEGGNWVVRID